MSNLIALPVHDSDQAQWAQYINRKAKKFMLDEERVVDVLCYCYGDLFAYNVRWGKYGMLLDTLVDREVDKCIRRTLDKLEDLPALVKLRKTVDDSDDDFIVESGYNIGV